MNTQILIDLLSDGSIVAMSFRSINAEPAELQRLATAFDAAWVEINARAPIDRPRQQAERARLAGILVQLWEARETDLVLAALQKFDCAGRQT